MLEKIENYAQIKGFQKGQVYLYLSPILLFLAFMVAIATQNVLLSIGIIFTLIAVYSIIKLVNVLSESLTVLVEILTLQSQK